jgi:hypothetical protein
MTELGDIPADEILRCESKSIHRLATTANDSVRVSGEDRVAKLVESSGPVGRVKNRLSLRRTMLQRIMLL